MTVEKDLKIAVDIAKRTVLENLDLCTIETGNVNPFGDRTLLLDQKTEDRLIEFFLTSDTKYRIFTEEKGIIESENQSEYLIILDPIDGSTNLMRGIPLAAVGIAAAPYTENLTTDDVEVSIIDSLFTKDTYIATNGKGVTKNGNPINSITEHVKEEIIISYNLRKKLEGDYYHQSLRILSSVYDMRRTGCPLLDLCWTSSGALDAMMDFRDTLPIVHVSGTHMVLEAGGYVLDSAGNHFCESFEINNRMSFVAARNKSLARSLHNAFMNNDS